MSVRKLFSDVSMVKVLELVLILGLVLVFVLVIVLILVVVVVLLLKLRGISAKASLLETVSAQETAVMK